jgi:Family of unknown function (DUF5681)
VADDDPKPNAEQNAASNLKPFVKGRSGNPAGKRKGTKHRKTLLLAAMTDDDREFVVRKIISQARRGCRMSQRLIVDRIEPARRGSPVKFALPEIRTMSDVVSALASISTAMSKGKLTPTEALEVAGVVELSRQALKTIDHEARLERIEAMMKGPNDEKL